MTVLEHIVSSLRSAAIYNKHDVAAPSVILWPDGQRQWESVAANIGESLGRFYTLNDEVTGTQAGPSTWIRYRLAADASQEGIPVIYLPGISRQAFRSPIEFPEAARHLYALQYLGAFWTQLNGKDWTPAAVLSSSDGGLGLDLAKDAATAQALATQLATVLDTPVEAFQGKRLESADFNSLSVSDPAGMMLRWLSDPEKVKSEWSAERVSAFQDLCKQQFHFNLASEGRLAAAEKLVAGGGPWDPVWSRYEEAPKTYPGVRGALALVKPNDLFGSASPRLPQKNQEAEDCLRKDLLALAGKPSPEVLGTLVKLAAEHRSRAASIWAQLGEASLAQAAAHLGRMAQAIQAGLAGTDWPSLAKAYLDSGWQVDAEARRSFAAVRLKTDMDAVTAALRAAYLPWLEQQAKRVAGWSASYPNASQGTARELNATPGTVYLFVDGLRTDVALELCELLENSGLKPSTTIAWSALPSVTATAKPAWQPLADLLCGASLSEKFEPQLAEDNKSLTTDGFRKRITELGFVWFSPSETGSPSGAGWTETADFDSTGHYEGAKLAWRIHEELLVVRQRVTELLQAGWKKVILVTDHGWLWLPGGLPKTELPTHLTASKWGRCAVPQPCAKHQLPAVPWFWANEHHVVLAPVVSAFWNGMEYAHGGLSLQETLTLAITIGDGHKVVLTHVAITSLRWLGLRLNVELQGALSEFTVDIRTKAADASSSLLGASASTQKVRPDGKVSVLVENEDRAGIAATLVVLHAGEVVAKQNLTVGEN